MIARRDEYWDIQKRRATQIESSNRHAVGGKSMHRARKKELIGCHRAMEDAPVGQSKRYAPDQGATGFVLRLCLP